MEIYNKLVKYAESKEGKLLSTSYTKASDKYLWQDSKGRQFEMTWLSARDYGTWSPFERKEKQIQRNLKYSLEFIQDFCKKKGGKFLSSEYKTDKDYYEFEDENGIVFISSWKRVYKEGKWGPDKRGVHRNLYNLETAKEWVESKGAKLLSTEWKGIEATYYFIDKDGGKFNQTFKTCLKHNDVRYIKSSRIQTELCDFVKSLGVNVKENDRIVLKGKEIDILSDNIGIELHGLKWHTTKKVARTLHRFKYEECKKNNIELVQIFENEWRDRKDQIKSFLRSKFGKNNIRLFARKCSIQKIDKKIAREFLHKYHIQGGRNKFKEAYGLIYNNELVSLITIGLHHRTRKEFALDRYVCKENVTVIGGLSKLVNAALRDYDKLKTWVDLRWSSGENWIKNGWKLTNTVDLGYFYYHPDKKIIKSKHSSKKNNQEKLSGVTELQIMQEKGFYPIYDAGKLTLTITR
jgi:hypothetical protein